MKIRILGLTLLLTVVSSLHSCTANDEIRVLNPEPEMKTPAPGIRR